MSEVLERLSDDPLPSAPRVLFMGTPDFAVPALRSLHRWCESRGGEVVAVVSQPDRPKGRGKRLQRTPVAMVADELGLACYQWSRLSQESYDQLRDLKYDLAVVIAYGKILPKRYLILPPWGCINLHASLLPSYRGAAPIQWAIINGERETGVSVMRLDEGMDTGPVAHTLRCAIERDDTSESLFLKLSDLSARALVEALNLWVLDSKLNMLDFQQQSECGVSHAPMLKKSDGMLDWSLSASRLEDLCRGVSPWPGAHTSFMGEPLKVKTLVAVSEEELNDSQRAWEPGVVVELDERGPMIRCGQGAAILTTVQRPSKRATTGAEFYRGYDLQLGLFLSEC